MKRRVTRKELMRVIRGLLLGSELDTSSHAFKTGYESALEDISNRFVEKINKRVKNENRRR